MSCEYLIMKLFFSILFSVIICIPLLKSQETLLEGTYNGQNLYVKNPSLTSDHYCVKGVTVNNKPSKTEIYSNAFEIDFSLLGLNPGDAVKIIITHEAGCEPVIINPEVIKSSSSVKFVSVEINKKNQLIWKIKGEPGTGPFEIEQYRWRRWMKSGEVNPSETDKPGEYLFEVTPTSGTNIFRLKMTDSKGLEVYSKEVKLRSSKREVKILEYKVKDKIDFSDYTVYEILDKNGNYITDGEGRSADVKALKKGEYWINYDNKADMFTKK